MAKFHGYAKVDDPDELFQLSRLGEDLSQLTVKNAKDQHLEVCANRLPFINELVLRGEELDVTTDGLRKIADSDHIRSVRVMCHEAKNKFA